MKRKLNLLQTLLLVILASATTWLITYTATLHGAEKDVENMIGSLEKFDKITEIQSYVDKYFVGEYDEKTAMEYAAAGYVEGLGDKWSYYMTAEGYSAFVEDQNTDYVGVGITVNYIEEEAALLILDVNENSPAEEAGLKPLQKIVGVNGQTIASLGYTDALSAIKGEEGTQVTLTVVMAGEAEDETRDIPVERRSMTKQYVYSDLLDDHIGYIRITEFSLGAQDGFLSAVDHLLSKGAESFIFDVRNNPGGDLNVLITILNRILSDKDLFIEEYQNGERHVFQSDATGLDCPISILTNRFSYSAAEYFAAVLQEYGAASVVGEATTGKGYGQTTFRLEDGSAIVISVIRYYTPEGRSLKESGVTPDVEVALDDSLIGMIGRMDAQTDPQLAGAIEAVGS